MNDETTPPKERNVYKMALTNKGLREILSEAGVDAEHMDNAVTRIMDRHNTTKNAIMEERDAAIKERDDARKERDNLKADAEKLGDVQKELDALKGGDWENKYKNLLAENTAKDARAAKENAVRQYFNNKNITGKALDIALLSVAAQIDALEIKKDGAIKDASALDALVAGPLAPLVSHEETVPAHNPPEAAGGSGGNPVMTVDEIYKIEDATERQKAIADHPGLFGYGGNNAP